MARKKPTAAKPKPAAKKRYEKPVVKKAITEFSWRGNTRYKCSACSFDSGDEGEAYSHYRQNHIVPEPKVREVETGLVTPGGDKIVRVEEASNGED